MPKSKWHALSPWHVEGEKRQRRQTRTLYDRHLAGRDENLGPFSMAQLATATRLDWQRIKADVVHLHWIAFAMDYASFFGSIPRSVPIVWTLHDMNAFTGGCHYSNGCERFKSACGSCPQVRLSDNDDVSSHSVAVKKRALQSRQVHVIAPSKWLLDLAKASPIWPAQTVFSHVRYGMDLQTLRPVAKRNARAKLGIDPDVRLIGFGADNIRDERKGIGPLLDSLERLPVDSNLEAIVFGGGNLERVTHSLRKLHQFGFVDDLAMQRTIYSACDLVIVPSREDNQPSMGLEAMACGTPVVAFDTGGIKEYVLPGSTGMLAPVGDTAHLASSIQWMLDHPEARRHMGERSRLMMLRDFDITRQSLQYLHIYGAMLNSHQQLSRAG
jgi:glycosyltransferase involved in cell wall biosynthesis